MRNKITPMVNSILYFILIVATVGLLTDKLIKISLSLILAVDAYLFLKKSSNINKPLIQAIIFIMTYSVIQAMFYNSNWLLMKEISRNIIYALIIYGVGNIYIEINKYEKIWIMVLAFCLSIQIVQYYKLFPINSYLSSFYGNSEDSAAIRVSNYNTLQYFRSGSIFIAINPYFKIVLGVFAITLSKRVRLSGKQNNGWTNVGIAIAICSSLLIGSRTCFLAMLCCLFIYLIFYS